MRIHGLRESALGQAERTCDPTACGLATVCREHREQGHRQLVVSVAELTQQPCILIASPDQEDVEREYYQDILGFRSDFLFARSREEGRMMVAGNRGFMPVEMREQTERTGSAIRRIPLVGQAGQLKSEYYCYWPKERTNNLVEEFADILSGIFEA